MSKKILDYAKKVQPVDRRYMEKMRKYHNTLLMPTGALEVLLSYVEKLAGIYKEIPVRMLKKKKVIVFAADHGIAEEGVSAYPQEVTKQMLSSFANELAVITVLAKHQELDISVIDVGVKGEPVKGKNIISKKVSNGTKNFLHENAMSKEELEKAFKIGVELAKETKAKGYDIVLMGEMGIGNTTSSSAVAAALLNLPVDILTGYGTGINETTFRQKIAIIEKALIQRKINTNDPLEILMKVGGFEIVAICGFLIGAGIYRLPVILDGFIGDVAALAAYFINPLAKDYWFAGQISQESGDKKILKKLALRPILDLDFRLGEASGSTMALPILEQAIAISRFTGTFEKAKVSDRK